MRKYIADNEQNILNHVPFTTPSFKAELTETGEYVVYSYTTPIAIAWDNGMWFSTKQRFSNTTTTQQHALRVIIASAGLEMRLSNPEQFKDLLTLAGL